MLRLAQNAQLLPEVAAQAQPEEKADLEEAAEPFHLQMDLEEDPMERVEEVVLTDMALGKEDLVAVLPLENSEKKLAESTLEAAVVVEVIVPALAV